MEKKCLIISGGEFSHCPEGNYNFIIAADKGLAYARQLHLSPDVILGDFDSLETLRPEWPFAPGENNSLQLSEKPWLPSKYMSLPTNCLPQTTKPNLKSKQMSLSEGQHSGLFQCDVSGYAGRSEEMSDVDLEIIEQGILKDPSGKEVQVLKLPKMKDDTDTMAAIRYAINRGCTQISVCCIMGGRFDHMLANLQAAAFAAEHGVPVSLIGDRDEIHVFQHASMEFPKREGWSISAFALSDAAGGIRISGAVYPAEDLTLKNTFPLGLSNEWKDDTITYSVKEGILAVVLSKMDDF